MLKILKVISLTATMLSTSFAETSSNTNMSEIEQKITQAISNMGKVAVDGPSSIPLGDQATLSLKEQYTFIPKNEASEYMEAQGNKHDPQLLGLVLNQSGEHNWVLLIKYIDEGYIKEDDAKNWNADELLESLKRGAEKANKERKPLGFPTFHVTGWIEKPTYDSTHHTLIWSIEGQDDEGFAGDTAEAEDFVNYNTYALGRHGFLQLTLITDRKNVDADKAHAANILNAINFNEGKRYEDFVEGQDRTAEYGLGALILGVAAKKLGLFAMAGVFLAKMWKVIIIGFVLLGGFIKRLFSRKKENEA